MTRAALLLLVGCATSGTGATEPGADKTGTRPAPPLPDSPPTAAAAPPLRLPPVMRVRLDNGLPVWIAEQHAIPRVAFVLAVLAGADADPSGRAGLAALTADMLDEGAGERSAMAIAEALADEGADLEIYTSASATYITLWSLSETESLAASLSVLGDIVTRPAFSLREFKRVRESRLGAILQRRDTPAVVAGEALAQAVYGTDHPYGWPVAGRAGTLSSIRHNDLKRFWRARYRPDNAAMIVVGATRTEEIVPLLSDAMEDWRTPPQPPTQAPAAPEGAGPRLVIVDRPGAPQSEVRIGHAGIARAHPDAFVVEVLGNLLGGSFASRLNNRLREQLGYTYGAWGFFDMRRGPGPFVMGAAVQTDVTAEAIGEFLAEVRRICAETPEEDEVARARDGLLRALPRTFEGASAIAGKLADLYVHDLPADYFEEYVERVGAVTPTEVRRAACEHARPEDLQVVVVGDRSAIEGGVVALSLGTPETWDAEGKPAP